MDNLLYQVGQYATKQEVLELIQSEVDILGDFRGTNDINALGENSQQRFEYLLMETREEGVQFPDPTKRPAPPDALYQESKYWTQDIASPQGIQHNQYTEPYVVPTQEVNVLPKTTLTNSSLYDSKYTPNRPTYTTPAITGSEGYTSESRWNNYKGVHVRSTVENSSTGDSILRSMGIHNPMPLQSSGFSTQEVETPPVSLHDNVKTPEYTQETPREILAQQSDPMGIIGIQMKMYTMSMGAGVTNSTFKKTEENLDKLSKGE